jgi:hypothetical protein
VSQLIVDMLRRFCNCHNKAAVASMVPDFWLILYVVTLEEGLTLKVWALMIIHVIIIRYGIRIQKIKQFYLSTSRLLHRPWLPHVMARLCANFQNIFRSHLVGPC